MSSSKPSPPWRNQQKSLRHKHNSSLSQENLLPHPTHRSPFRYPVSSPPRQNIRKLGPCDCSVELSSSAHTNLYSFDMGWSFRKQLAELDRQENEETEGVSILSDDDRRNSSRSVSRTRSSRSTSATPYVSKPKRPRIHSSQSSSPHSRVRNPLPQCDGDASQNHHAPTLEMPHRAATAISPASPVETCSVSSRSSSRSDTGSPSMQHPYDPRVAIAKRSNSLNRSSPVSEYALVSASSSKISISSILNPVPVIDNPTVPTKTILSEPYSADQCFYRGGCRPSQESINEQYRVGVCC